MTPHESPRSGTRGGSTTRGLIAGLVIGVPVMAFGVRGVLVDATDTHPAELARWIVGAAVVHDLLLLPVAGAAAWALHRLTPRRAWPYVRAAALTVAVLALVAWPFVRGYGRDPANPSLFPRNYAVGVVAASATVAGAMAGAALIAPSAARLAGRARRARRTRDPQPPTRASGPGATPGR
jgi:hypothetical protein